MSDHKGNSSSFHPMSKSGFSRIQSTQAKGGQDMSSGGFASRAQSAGDCNTNTDVTGQMQDGRNTEGGKK